MTDRVSRSGRFSRNSGRALSTAPTPLPSQFIVMFIRLLSTVRSAEWQPGDFGSG